MGWDSSERFQQFLGLMPLSIVMFLDHFKLHSFTQILDHIDTHVFLISREEYDIPRDLAIYLLEKMQAFIPSVDSSSVDNQIWEVIQQQEHRRIRLLSRMKENLLPNRQPPRRKARDFEAVDNLRVGEIRDVPTWDSTDKYQRFVKNLPVDVTNRLIREVFKDFRNLIRYIDNNKVEIQTGQKGMISVEAAIYLLERMQKYIGLEEVNLKRQHLLDELNAFVVKTNRKLKPIPPSEPLQQNEPSPIPSSQPNATVANQSSTPNPSQSELSTPQSPRKISTKITRIDFLQEQYTDHCPVCMQKMTLKQLAGHIDAIHHFKKVNCRFCGINVSFKGLAKHLLNNHHGELSDRFQRAPFQSRFVMQVKVRIPAEAENFENRYEYFCRAIPVEMVERLKSLNLESIWFLLQYLYENKAEVLNNNVSIMADEAVLILRRMKSLGILDLRTTELLQYFSGSPNLKGISLTKPSPYKCACPICGEVLAMEWLFRHMLIDPGHVDVTFQCPYCPARARAAAMFNHLTKVHRDRLQPVYEPIQKASEEIKRLIEKALPHEVSTIETPYIVPLVVESQNQEHGSEKEFPVSVHFSQLHDFRPIKRTRKSKQVKITAEITDRGYFVSQASLVKTERASQTHAEVLSILVAYLTFVGVEVSETFLIDAYAEFNGPNIFEVKSIDNNNEKSQIRHAIAQLYEYRYIYRLRDARLWLVLSHQPETLWILDYLLEDRNISVLWVNDGCLAGQSLGELSELLTT